MDIISYNDNGYVTKYRRDTLLNRIIIFVKKFAKSVKYLEFILGCLFFYFLAVVCCVL